MAKKNDWSRIKAKRLTPIMGMRQFLGDRTFMTATLVTLLFAYLHQRTITAEMDAGGGGFWCVLGIPAVLCLVISTLLTYFGAKTRLLPALVPVLGMGGIEVSIVMFFVIVVRRMLSAGGWLGILQEVTMLAFLAAWFVCFLLLIMTGIGMKVPPAAGIAAMVTTITAMFVFIVRAMYTFSSLITALSRNLLLPDGAMANEIQWVLRSMPAGTDEARAMYFDRILDCVGIALLMMCCIPLALKFNGFFSEQAVMLRNAKDIPLPTQQRVVYTGYEEYTEDVPTERNEEFALTSDGYYVEKTVTARPKFKRWERTESFPAEESRTDEAQLSSGEETSESNGEYISEYYDDYVPGEGWVSFRERAMPHKEQTSAQTDKAEATGVTQRVIPVRAEKPIVDPKDPNLWNQYSD